MNLIELLEYLEDLKEDYGHLPVIFGQSNGNAYEIAEPPELAIVGHSRDEFAFPDGSNDDDINCIVLGG